MNGRERASDAGEESATSLQMAVVFAVGCACSLVPRLLVGAAPVYPDSALYLYSGMLGEPHSHMIFRWVAVVPIWFSGLWTDDPYAVCQIHGCLMAVVGVLAMCALCRVVRLSMAESLAVVLLFAANPDAIALSGWAPLTDVTYGIAVVFAVAAYVAWTEQRLHPAVLGVALAALLGIRETGAFVVVGVFLLRPWASRGWRATAIAAGYSAGALVLYFVISGLIVARDPLWALRTLPELYEIGQTITRNRDRTLNNVAGVLIQPRAVGPLLIAVYVTLKDGGRRFLPLLWCAAFVLIGYDVFDALSDNLAVRERRFPPILYLCFPMLAVYWNRYLRSWPAVSICALLFLLATGLSAGAELFQIDWPYLLDATDARSKTKWLLVALWSAGLLGVALRRPAVLGAVLACVLAIRGALDMHELIHFYQVRSRDVARIAEPTGACPEAIVQEHVSFSEMLGQLNRLLNGSCTRMHVVVDPSEVAALPLRSGVVFSQFDSIPGYRGQLISRRWSFRRFTK